jgi:hypothetical protein
MKNIGVLFSLVLLVSSSASAYNSVAGNTYSRIIKSRPMGAPEDFVGTFQHSLSFSSESSRVVDNGSTWFGNPPQTCAYRELRSKVLVACAHNGKTYITSYMLSDDGNTLTEASGQKFTLNLARSSD